MGKVLAYLANMSLKDWGTVALVLLAACGLLYMGATARDCSGTKNLNTVVKTLIQGQVDATKETTATAHTLLEAHRATLENQKELETELENIRAEYSHEMLELEKSIHERDRKLQAELQKKFTERNAALKEMYEKALVDPETARDSFIDSLGLWDNLWSSSPGANP